MRRFHEPKHNPAVRKEVIKRGGQTMFSISMVSLVILAVLIGLKLFGLIEAKPVVRIGEPLPESTAVIAETLPPPETPARDPNQPLVGLVSGHKGYDPGAVCEDGLTEAEVNYAVALEVVELLGRRGVQADLLDEFDDRLADYQAEALVSIHADSCTIAGATGFKVARVTNSAIPEAEDRLVACLNQEYGTYTGLPQHPGSITDNMTSYHAFNEIAPLTPGAIIEIGFLLDDRLLLQYKPKVIARGIAAGILCFLESNPAP
jgi:N-acetylmuramoyl-L-alanine amidase